MRIEETFHVAQPPELVFDYMTDPANLADWQTVKTKVEPLTEGPPRQGTRIRERTKPPVGREFDQIVEFTKFERPRLVRVHIVEGPYPVDGEWAFEPQDGGTRVHFTAAGELTGAARLMQPLVRRMVARQFAGYHENLRRLLESA